MPQGARIHATDNYAVERQAFRHPRTSLGSAAHWIKEAGILAPIAISEFVEDPGQKWHYIRMASLITALFSQGMWTARIHAERKAALARGGYERA